ncbi:Uncharacterised protein [Mycobacteroides abscessus subsp. abscessus]|nr:Uncharacterised protein [Mycobacteroides abscessus subsp. abscessus]
MRIARSFQLRPIPTAIDDGGDQLADVGTLLRGIGHGRHVGARVVGLAEGGQEVATQSLDQVDECADLLDRTRIQQRHFAFGAVEQCLIETDTRVLGVHRDARLGAVADATARRVEDSAQTHRVVGIGDGAQVGHDVADLLALVEAGATDHLVRNAMAHKDFFDGS